MCWKDYSRPSFEWQVDRWQVNWVDDGAGSSDLQTDARTLDMERRYIISTSTLAEERYRTSCASAPLVPIFQNTQWWHLEAFQDKPEKKYPFGTDIPRKEMPDPAPNFVLGNNYNTDVRIEGFPIAGILARILAPYTGRSGSFRGETYLEAVAFR